MNKILYFIAGTVVGAAGGYALAYIRESRKVKEANLVAQRAIDKMLYIADLADYEIVDLDDVLDEPGEAEVDRYSELVRQYHEESDILPDGTHVHVFDHDELTEEDEEILASLEHPRDDEDEEKMPEYQEDVQLVEGLEKAEERTMVRVRAVNSGDFKPPYPITTDILDEGEEQGYDKIDLTYFELDNVLIDESETPVSIQETIGAVTLSTHWGFGGMPKDAVAIRNERKQVDYLVTRLIGEYRGTYYPDRQDEVLDDQNRIIREGENDERSE